MPAAVYDAAFLCIRLGLGVASRRMSSRRRASAMAPIFASKMKERNHHTCTARQARDGLKLALASATMNMGCTRMAVVQSYSDNIMMASLAEREGSGMLFDGSGPRGLPVAAALLALAALTTLVLAAAGAVRAQHGEAARPRSAGGSGHCSPCGRLWQTVALVICAFAAASQSVSRTITLPHGHALAGSLASPASPAIWLLLGILASAPVAAGEPGGEDIQDLGAAGNVTEAGNDGNTGASDGGVGGDGEKQRSSEPAPGEPAASSVESAPDTAPEPAAEPASLPADADADAASVDSDLVSADAVSAPKERSNEDSPVSAGSVSAGLVSETPVFTSVSVSPEEAISLAKALRMVPRAVEWLDIPLCAPSAVTVEFKNTHSAAITTTTLNSSHRDVHVSVLHRNSNHRDVQ
ncbi:hypothetical protein T492DRAFT_834869 [Pavlovales sp. CCMP2436]|nr:hypothetical protein T492DRAFT_834869 [Pavlovales sp. CCMP2436]